jgi:pimeloyl-ACP methyl ester carboxylesterase
LIVDDSRPPVPRDYVKQLQEAVASDRPGDAVEIFMTKAVGIPAEFVAGMRSQPMWPSLEAIAHTIAYDGAFMEGLMFGEPIPPERAKSWASMTVPTLVLDGGASEQFMHTGADALAVVIPNAQRHTLDGQTHDVDAEILAPVLAEFFAG